MLKIGYYQRHIYCIYLIIKIIIANKIEKERLTLLNIREFLLKISFYSHRGCSTNKIKQ